MWLMLEAARRQSLPIQLSWFVNEEVAAAITRIVVRQLSQRRLLPIGPSTAFATAL